MARGRTLILIAGGLALLGNPLVARSDIPGNPYQGIVERNVFNLKPPLGPDANQPPPEPPPKITLTGFTTILGDKRVLFKVQQPPKPPHPAKEESFILTEGQRDGDIEVLEVNEKAGTARFNNHGTVQTLDLVNDGSKPSTAPPPIPAAPPKAYTPFGIQNPAPPAPQPAAPSKNFPARSLRIPQVPNPPPIRPFPTAPGQRMPNMAQ